MGNPEVTREIIRYWRLIVRFRRLSRKDRNDDRPRAAYCLDCDAPLCELCWLDSEICERCQDIDYRDATEWVAPTMMLLVDPPYVRER